MKKDFAVIGLGTFGRQLCRELSDKNANVLALDINEERVNLVAEFIPQAFCCDCSKEEVLKKLEKYKRKLVYGSEEYEIVFAKLYEEELRKRGLA